MDKMMVPHADYLKKQVHLLHSKFGAEKVALLDCMHWQIVSFSSGYMRNLRIFVDGSVFRATNCLFEWKEGCKFCDDIFNLNLCRHDGFLYALRKYYLDFTTPHVICRFIAMESRKSIAS